VPALDAGFKPAWATRWSVQMNPALVRVIRVDPRSSASSAFYLVVLDLRRL
jgi:hypothetical protein